MIINDGNYYIECDAVKVEKDSLTYVTRKGKIVTVEGEFDIQKIKNAIDDSRIIYIEDVSYGMVRRPQIASAKSNAFSSIKEETMRSEKVEVGSDIDDNF